MSKSRSVVPPESPPSIEVVRQRAKHRLIGVTVLVLAAVLVFPLLFDTQPRPVPVDIAIEIPSRKAAKPLQVDTPAVVSGPIEQPAAASEADKEEVIIDSKSAAPKATSAPMPPSDDREPTKPTPAKPETHAAKAEAPAVKPTAGTRADSQPAKPAPAKPESHASKPEAPAKDAAPKTPVVPPGKPDDAARAQALLEGRPAPAPAPAVAEASVRFIVQVGAFADPDAAQTVRLKLERAGLKTYTHVAQTPEGKRTRVRLGPFATRAEADKAAAKAKSLGLAAAVLTL